MSALAAILAVLLPLAAHAAGAARTAGKVLQARSKLAPSSDGPVFREGRVTLLDKAARQQEYKATPRTKVTLDGKPAKFQKAAVPGALALAAVYDPATLELASLDLKSGPRPAAEEPVAGAVHGEVANTDIFKNVLTVRSADKVVREFLVPETAKIRKEADGKLGAPIGLEGLQVGDAVEVYSTDGKTAVEIHARAAR